MATTVLARVDRDVVVVSGPDATSFLQSLLSQDLDPVAVGETRTRCCWSRRASSSSTCARCTSRADEWWCVCEAGLRRRRSPRA